MFRLQDLGANPFAVLLIPDVLVDRVCAASHIFPTVTNAFRDRNNHVPRVLRVSMVIAL